MPEMDSTGNRTAAQTDDSLAYLCALFNRIFTWASTWDGDTRAALLGPALCYVCVAESLVITTCTTAAGSEGMLHDTTLPLPET